MKKKLVIIGASGFGREVVWQVSENSIFMREYEILGFIDDNPELQNKEINGYKVIGNLEWLNEVNYEISALICIGNSKVRKNIYEKIKSNQYIEFPNFIADDVKMSSTVKLGKGCIICFSNILTVNIEIGDFFISNLDCTIGHDVKIEDFVTLYPSVNVSGNTYIDECTEVGTGTNIIQGKKIGKNVIVGAGSVVIRDIENDKTAVGVPAKVIK